MKKSDWALVILVVAVVGVISYFVIGSLLPPPADEEVKTAPSITASIEVPENNVILYDEDRPSWYNDKEKEIVRLRQLLTEVEDASQRKKIEQELEVLRTSDKQYINSIFNVCEINSSFKTFTDDPTSTSTPTTPSEE